MIWIPMVLAMLAEPIVHGETEIRPTLGNARGGGKSRGKFIMRQRDLGPTAAPRALAFEDWERIADLIHERGRAMRGSAA